MTGIVTFGPFSFDRHNHELRRDGEIVPLPARCAALLGCLVDRAGSLVSKQEIIDEVWSGRIVMDHSLAEAVAVLRTALDENARSPTYVETVPRRGYRFIADVAEAESSTEGPFLPTPGALAVSRPGLTLASRLSAALALVLLIAVAGSPSGVALSGQSGSATAVQVAITLEDEHPLDINWEITVRLSPDGESIIYQSAAAAPGEPSLYRRQLDEHRAVPVLGSEGAAQPELSPDGERIAAFRPDGPDGEVNWRYQLITLPVEGGKTDPFAITGVPFGVDWIDAETLVFADLARVGRAGPERSEKNGLYSISLNDRDRHELATPDATRGEYGYVWPHVLPGGHFAVFTIIHDRSNPRPEDASIALLDLRTLETSILVESGAFARSAPGGRILFARTDHLLVVDLDMSAVPPVTVGEPRRVLDDLITYGVHAQASFDVSDRGHLVFVRGPAPETAPGLVVARRTDGEVEWIDPPGPGFIGPVAFSPDADGRHVIWGRSSPATTTLNVLDRVTRARTPYDQPAGVSGMVFSEDGTRISFARSEEIPGEDPVQMSHWSVREQALDGSDPVERWGRDGWGNLQVNSRTNAGSLLLTRWMGPTLYDLWEVSADGEARPLLDGPDNEVCPDVSPDGSWLAYASREGADWHVYVRSYPSLQGKTRVSAEPASSPRWAADGSGLYYASAPAGGRTLIQFLPFDSASGTATGSSTTAVDLEWPLSQGVPMCRFAVSPDGSEFLLPVSVKNRPFETTEINLLANWAASDRPALLATGNRDGS